jgi:ABC-type branched-subunit amino acid transport system substrate-binding protein
MGAQLAYHYSGSLGSDNFYIERSADQELYNHLRARQTCFVFNCRQMGKSSLRVRTMQRLQAEGVVCVEINPQQRGASLSEDQWYAGTIHQLIKDVGLKEEVSFSRWWEEPVVQALGPVERLWHFIDQILLKRISLPIVIFVEEVDYLLSLPFDTDGLFGLIRALHERRPDHPAYQRLTFCLIGVATPFDLIRDRHRTVFNIGQSVELKRLTPQQAKPLLAGLVGRVGDPAAVLDAVLHWSGGQPFLTQKLLALVWAKGAQGEAVALVAEVVREQILHNWEAQDVPTHLLEIRTRLLRGDDRQRDRLLRLVRAIHEQDGIPVDGSRDQLELRLTGLVVPIDGQLRFYNPIYAAVFHPGWVWQQMQDLRPRIYAEAFGAWREATIQERPSHLLSGAPLKDAQHWAEGRSLNDDETAFLKASHSAEANLRQLKALAWVGGVLLLAFGGWGTVNWIQNQSAQSRLERYCLSAVKRVSISCGERDLSSEDYPPTPDERQGRRSFFQKNYAAAVRSLDNELNRPQGLNPGLVIARNNAKILSEPGGKTIHALAVSLPFTNSRPFIVKSLLAGVAEAQTDFNANTPNRRLFVVMADDQNESDQAQEIAIELEKEPIILALIGSYSSQITFDLLQALSAKDERGKDREMPLLSATSTASLSAYKNEKRDDDSEPKARVAHRPVSTKRFFRTVSTTEIGAKSLLDYAKKHRPRHDKILVFYQDNDLFARSFFEDLKSQLQSSPLWRSRLVPMNIDRGASSLIPAIEAKISAEIAAFRAEQGDGPGSSVVAMVPDAFRTEESRSAIRRILWENRNGDFLIVGANTVYGPDLFLPEQQGLPSVLSRSQKARERLVVHIPAYTDSKQQMAGKYWHYATAYDATNLFLKVVGKILQGQASVSRKAIVDELSRGGLEFRGQNGEFRLKGSERDPQTSVLVRPDCAKGSCYWRRVN